MESLEMKKILALTILTSVLCFGAHAAEPRQVSLKGLAGQVERDRTTWSFLVTPTIRDRANRAVGGATVVVNFQFGGTRSCVTNGSGSCTVRVDRLSYGFYSNRGEVTGVSGNNMVYVPAHNTVQTWVSRSP